MKKTNLEKALAEGKRAMKQLTKGLTPAERSAVYKEIARLAKARVMDLKETSHSE